MRSRVQRSGGIAAILVGFFGSTGRAEGNDKAVAEALFEKGRAAMSQSDYATACASFEESNRLDPAPGTMANLAGCEDKRGHLAAAWQWFQEAVEKLPAGDPRREIAEQRATELKARLPLLTIRLAPTAPASTKVLRDGLELRSISLGTALPADPGVHVVVASAPGFSDKQYSVELHEGDKNDLAVEPGPAVAVAGTVVGSAAQPNVPPPPAAASTTSDNQTLGYVIGGVGVAGIGTALVLGGLALGKKSTVDSHCSTGSRTCDSQSAIDAASAGKTLSTVSTVSFIVGAAATGLGAYLVLTSHHGHPTTAIDAAAFPGGGFVNLEKTF